MTQLENFFFDGYGADRRRLRSVGVATDLMEKIVRDSNVNVVRRMFEEPYGKSNGVEAVYVLMQSHLALSTNQEELSVHLGFNACSGDHSPQRRVVNPRKVGAAIKSTYGARRVEYWGRVLHLTTKRERTFKSGNFSGTVETIVWKKSRA